MVKAARQSPKRALQRYLDEREEPRSEPGRGGFESQAQVAETGQALGRGSARFHRAVPCDPGRGSPRRPRLAPRDQVGRLSPDGTARSGAGPARHPEQAGLDGPVPHHRGGDDGARRRDRHSRRGGHRRERCGDLRFRGAPGGPGGRPGRRGGLLRLRSPLSRWRRPAGPRPRGAQGASRTACSRRSGREPGSATATTCGRTAPPWSGTPA